MKRALITGITGQDGSFLAELLLAKNYEVHGLRRRSSSFNTGRIEHVYQDPHQVEHPRLILHYGDMTDATNLIRLIADIRPDEIYNLAAQSHVAVSFETPEYTANADALGTLRILEAIRILKLVNKTRFYQASTSELYGNSPAPQDETTPFAPRSPYAAAKLYAYWITRNYREAYGMFACNGILYNHESSRRGETFVTRKITRAVAAIAAGKQDFVYLGNLRAVRDWGHARDYVAGMHAMMQHDTPDDFVFATGVGRTVMQFADEAFRVAGLGDAAHYVRTDAYYLRPTEVDRLIGNYAKAKKILGWQPTTPFEDMVREMVYADMDFG